MATNKKESFVYNLIVCAAMTYLMGVVNLSINMGAFSRLSIWTATKGWPVTFLVGLTIATLIIYPIARWATFHFITPQNSANAKIMFMSFFMVCGMSLCMSLFKIILMNGFTNNIINIFLKNWPRSFCIAMFIQLILVGPFSREMLGLIFEKKRLKLIYIINSQLSER